MHHNTGMACPRSWHASTLHPSPKFRVAKNHQTHYCYIYFESNKYLYIQINLPPEHIRRECLTYLPVVRHFSTWKTITRSEHIRITMWVNLISGSAMFDSADSTKSHLEKDVWKNHSEHRIGNHRHSGAQWVLYSPLIICCEHSSYRTARADLPYRTT